MLHIPGILDCTYHLHVSCLCAQGSSIAEYLDYSRSCKKRHLRACVPVRFARVHTPKFHLRGGGGGSKSATFILEPRCLQAHGETNFNAFRRQFVTTLRVLMYINLTEILEQLVLLARHLFGNSGAEVEFLDAEISVFNYFIMETLPLLVVIFNTPDWRARHRPDNGLWLTTISPWVVKGFLWLGWWQFLLWGAHMSCHPKVAAKAKDGGILFVLARASAASIYFDLIVLFLTIWPGVKLVLQSCIGMGMSSGFTRLHMMIGKRILISASIHAVSHLVWFSVDGFADGESVYSGKVWDGKVLLTGSTLPHGHGDVGSFRACLPSPCMLQEAQLRHLPILGGLWESYFSLIGPKCNLLANFCQKLFRASVGSIHRASAIVVLSLGIVHSLTGVLGAPKLFASWSPLKSMLNICDGTRFTVRGLGFRVFRAFKPLSPIYIYTYAYIYIYICIDTHMLIYIYIYIHADCLAVPRPHRRNSVWCSVPCGFWTLVEALVSFHVPACMCPKTTWRFVGGYKWGYK